jgi:hypothetical protein
VPAAAVAATLMLVTSATAVVRLTHYQDRNSHNNETLLNVQLNPYMDSGSSVYKFPQHHDRTGSWSLLTPSDAFFMANQAELVTLRRLTTAADARKTYELLAVDETSNKIERLKVSVSGYTDRPRFSQKAYEATVVENSMVGSEILVLDRYLSLINGDSADSFRLDRKKMKPSTESEEELPADLIQPEPVKLVVRGDIIRLVTQTPIDYEQTQSLDYHLVAVDSVIGVELAAADIHVRIINEDDNLPMFVDPTVYYLVYNPLHSTGKYPTVGKVSAADADGDKVFYRARGSKHHGGCCIVVPQTGNVIVINAEFNRTVLSVDAVEKNNEVRK